MKNIILFIFVLFSYFNVSFPLQILRQGKPKEIFPRVNFPEKIICSKYSDAENDGEDFEGKIYKADNVYFTPDDLMCRISGKPLKNNAQNVNFDIFDTKFIPKNPLARMEFSYVKSVDNSIDVAIGLIFVHRQIRSQKLGHYLISALEQSSLVRMKRLNISLLCMAPLSEDSKGSEDKLHPEDKKRLAFYTRLGFEKSGSWEEDDPFGWLMTKNITKSNIN